MSGTSYSLSSNDELSECDQCIETLPTEPEESNCCSTKPKYEHKKPADDCCSDDKEFIKIETEYNITSTHEVQFIAIELLELCSFDFDEGLFEISHKKVQKLSLPPPKTGADIVILLGQQKTDPAPIA